MPGVFDYAAISRVQQANDIVDVVSEHVSLTKKGREMVGLCPFHEDHRPSLYVNPTKQIFKCFACGVGGDVLKFVQMRESLTFPQAVERLAERAGIALEPVRRASRQSDGGSQDADPGALARVNAWACKFFQKCLDDGEQGQAARDYLAARQINRESIERWRIGFAPNAVDALVRAARARDVPSDLLRAAGLTSGASQDRFVNRLMFAITDVTGRCVGFGGRTLSGAGAKYINSPTTVLFDKSNTLYGLEQARHEIVSTGVAVVVEGYTDVIMAHQLGCTNVVATLGTSFTTGHGRMLRRYAKKAVLVFDGDTAGIEAANRALEVCLSQRLDIKLAFVPEGKDPCDFLLEAGRERFECIVAEATDVMQFKWSRLQAAFKADESLANRRVALDEFLQAVATGMAAQNLPLIESGLMINKLSKIIGLEPAEINRDLRRRTARASQFVRADDGRIDREAIDWGRGVYAVAQRELLEVLINEPELVAEVEGKIGAGDFDVPVLHEIASVLFDVVRSGQEFSVRAVLAGTESVATSEAIVELQRVGEAKGNYRSRLLDAVAVLERRREGSGTVPAGETQKEPNAENLRKPASGRQNPHSIGMT
jgi:DNA primase